MEVNELLNFGSKYVYIESKTHAAAEHDIELESGGLQQESAPLLDSDGPNPTSEISGDTPGATATCSMNYDDAVFNMKNVYTLTDAVVDWNGLGIQLDVNPDRLKKILRENQSEDERRSDMIRTWMHSDPQASWDKLSEALERVEHRVLANKIHTQVLPTLNFVSPLPTSREKTRKTRCAPGPPTKIQIPAFRGKSAEVQCDAPLLPPRESNTNILMIKFGALSKPCKVHTGDPVVCSNDQCAAILNHISKISSEETQEKKLQVWVCEFCSTRNVIEIEMEEIPKEGEILYLQEVQRSPKDDKLVSGITKDSIVVFCIDASGSMGQTYEVPGHMKLKGYEKLQKLNELYIGSGMQYIPGQSRNVTYISRLQCVQAAIEHQLNMLAQNNPSQRVAVVTFNNEVTIIGDGRPENEFVIVGDKLWKEKALLKMSEELPTPSAIKETKELLSERIYSIEDEGQTALGGALLISVQLAKRAAGSKVILCTDGLANRGIGSLDDHKCIESSVDFYKRLGISAKESSASVSVLTIKGTACDLLHLGQVASQSGGHVDVVDPMSVAEEFVNILSTSVVAVHVNARVILHPTLCFKDGDSKSTLSVPVGNVMDTTELMYEFTTLEGSQQNEQSNLHKLPFQVQIKYKSLDGQQCLRVLTESRLVTSNKTEANKGAIGNVLRAHQQHKRGRLAIYGTRRFNSIEESSTSTKANHSSLASYDYASSGDLRFRIMKNTRVGAKLFKDRSSTVDDEAAAAAYKNLNQHVRRMASHVASRVSDHVAPVIANKMITLTNEGYGFGFLVSAGKEGETIVQSLIPDGVAWKDKNLQIGDKIVKINKESVEGMPHQDVVKKLRQLNDEAGSITLSVMREEETFQEHQRDAIMPPIRKVEALQQPVIPLNHLVIRLSNEGYGFGFTIQQTKEKSITVCTVLPESVACKDGRLSVGDKLVEVNGRKVSDVTFQEVITMLRELNEEDHSTLELKIERDNGTML